MNGPFAFKRGTASGFLAHRVVPGEAASRAGSLPGSEGSQNSHFPLAMVLVGENKSGAEPRTLHPAPHPSVVAQRCGQHPRPRPRRSQTAPK